MPILRFFGNILWFIFGGFTALIWVLGGALLCITIVGIPFGLQAFKIARMALFPFGIETEVSDRALGCPGIFFNVLWAVVIGWELMIAHLISALILAAFIVTIPFALQHLKLAKLAIWPFGQEIRRIRDADLMAEVMSGR